jgi:hypothetical protein
MVLTGTEMVDPSVPLSCSEDLAERHDFLAHGVMPRRFAEAASPLLLPISPLGLHPYIHAGSEHIRSYFVA